MPRGKEPQVCYNPYPPQGADLLKLRDNPSFAEDG